MFFDSEIFLGLTIAWLVAHVTPFFPRSSSWTSSISSGHRSWNRISLASQEEQTWAIWLVQSVRFCFAWRFVKANNCNIATPIVDKTAVFLGHTPWDWWLWHSGIDLIPNPMQHGSRHSMYFLQYIFLPSWFSCAIFVQKPEAVSKGPSGFVLGQGELWECPKRITNSGASGHRFHRAAGALRSCFSWLFGGNRSQREPTSPTCNSVLESSMLHGMTEWNRTKDFGARQDWAGL